MHKGDAKMTQMVEISREGFFDTLEALRDRYSGSDDAFELLVEMVDLGFIDMTPGPLSVVDSFDSFTVVRSDRYEKLYPKYSKVMTWGEFVCNECIVGNDKCAILDE